MMKLNSVLFVWALAPTVLANFTIGVIPEITGTNEEKPWVK